MNIDRLEAIETRLRAIAADIAKAGIVGFGNAVVNEADELAAIRSEAQTREQCEGVTDEMVRSAFDAMDAEAKRMGYQGVEEDHRPDAERLVRAGLQAALSAAPEPAAAPVGPPTAEEVEMALLLVSDTEASREMIEAWTNEQRERAFEWAMALHYRASDNDDIVVPPRPEYIPRSITAAPAPEPQAEPDQVLAGDGKPCHGYGTRQDGTAVCFWPSCNCRGDEAEPADGGEVERIAAAVAKLSAVVGFDLGETAREAALKIRSQAARIAELEAQIAGLGAAPLPGGRDDG